MFFCAEKRSRSRRPRSATWRCTWPARQTRPKLTSLASPSLENRERMRQKRKKRRKKVSPSAVQAFHKWLFNSRIKQQVVNVEFPVRKIGNESEHLFYIYFWKNCSYWHTLHPITFFSVQHSFQWYLKGSWRYSMYYIFIIVTGLVYNITY